MVNASGGLKSPGYGDTTHWQGTFRLMSSFSWNPRLLHADTSVAPSIASSSNVRSQPSGQHENSAISRPEPVLALMTLATPDERLTALATRNSESRSGDTEETFSASSSIARSCG